MNTIQVLTLRRNAALGKLANLQRRAERLSPAGAAVVTTALEELNTSLEELQVATEQLEHEVVQLADARHQLEALRRQMQEFVDIVPVACVWTRADGEIDQANAAAATLLNVAAHRLSGRPLPLFVADRARLTEGLLALNQRLTSIVEIAAVVRPRERRPRPVRLIGSRLQSDGRLCWFLAEPPSATATAADLEKPDPAVE